MWDKIPFHPEAASTFASEIDILYFVLWGLTIVFTIIVAIMVLVLATRYRRGAKVDRSHPVHTHHGMELTWSIVPLLLGLVIFAWGAKLYADAYKVPANAKEIFVIGKQWMWHIQHPNGIRENNELHVPVGQPTKLTMISQDVIHSFFIPAFRIKRDVLPGLYTNAWFEATKPGKYHLFCAEFCGTEHSKMIGTIYVMEPADYQRWLDSGGEKGGDMKTPVIRKTIAEEGAELFQSVGCANCHSSQDNPRGPSLYGIYGTMRRLQNNLTVKADREYMREAILKPNDRLTAGFEATMPTYDQQLKEEQVSSLIAYIQSLGTPAEPALPGEELPTRGGMPVTKPAPAKALSNTQGENR